MLIAPQVAAGMEYMHSMGIIHFDLKGPNVLLDMYFQGGKYVMETKIDFRLWLCQGEAGRHEFHARGWNSWMDGPGDGV